MSTRFLTLSAILLTSLTWNGAAAAADLDNAMALYAEASYEEALEALSAADMDADADVVDQFRALCLLALNRELEAELSLERIASRSPLYRINETAVSPRVLEMFLQVRLRVFPTTARDLYNDVKARYDRKEFSKTRLGFTRLAEIIQEASAIGAGEDLRDLSQLGAGFLAIIEAKLAPPAEPVPSEPLVAVAEPAVLEGGRIYSSVDGNVAQPVAIVQVLPAWLPPDGPLRESTVEGSVEFVIDENGVVVQAWVPEPMWPPYDRKLIKATRNWRFHPAMFEETPVKFRHQMSITLAPPER